MFECARCPTTCATIRGLSGVSAHSSCLDAEMFVRYDHEVGGRLWIKLGLRVCSLT